MKTMFLDIEWGQVYGSYRGDFILIEVGAVISGLKDGAPILENKEFHPNIDLVIRKNIINKIGKTIGFSERVANIGQEEYKKPFDPSYRLKKTDKAVARRLSSKVLIELRRYLHNLFKKYQISHIVLFGGREDLKLLQKAKVDTSEIIILDIQSKVQKETHYLFSLDKLSLIMGFYSGKRLFGSENLQYPLAERFKSLIKPHRAIGDACRIFVIYEEFSKIKPKFVQRCIDYIQTN